MKNLNEWAKGKPALTVFFGLEAGTAAEAFYGILMALHTGKGLTCRPPPPPGIRRCAGGMPRRPM